MKTAEELFEEYATSITKVGGELPLSRVLTELVWKHNNVSWAATLIDLAELVEEITGIKPNKPEGF